jgi:hypothetical protein
MAIPIVEPIIWRQLPADSPANMRNAVIQALLDAGWTKDSGAAIALPYSIATLTGLPNNGGTVTIGPKVYTFKTTLTSPGVANEVLIGVDAVSSIANLAAAISAGVGAGVVYGTGTTVNSDVTVAPPSGATLQATGISATKYQIATTSNCTNFAWGFPFLADISDRFISAPTSQDGLQYAVRVFLPWISGVSCIGIQTGTADWAKNSAWVSNVNGNAVGMHPKCVGFPEIIAHKHGAIIFYRGNPAGLGGCWWQVLQLPIEASPGAIQDALVDGTGALIYQPGHGYVTGQNVTIAQLPGVGTLDLRGTWSVAVVDANYYRLDNSSALSGPYDSSHPARAAGASQSVQAMFCSWDDWNDGVNSWSMHCGFLREMFYWPYLGGSHHQGVAWANGYVGEAWMCYQNLAFWDQNPNPFGGSSSYAGFDDLQMYGVASMGGRQWFGGRFQLLDAIVGWSTQGYTGTSVPDGVGYLFNTVLVTKGLSMDAVVTDDDGKDWIVIGARSDLSISVLMRVPKGYN